MLAILREWEESERGWGIRPDGFSLHLNEAEMERHEKEYWAGMPTKTPDEYSRPSDKGNPVFILSDELKRELLKKGSLRFWQSDYRKMCGADFTKDLPYGDPGDVI